MENNTKNNIRLKQNEPKQVEKLAAQRQCYWDAKTVQVWQLALTLPPPIVWSILKLSNLNVFGISVEVSAAFYGMIVLLLNIFIFAPWQEALKEKAAKIQELFDCDVLEIEWNSLKVGAKPNIEDINDAVIKYAKKRPLYPGLKDWYGEGVGLMPIEVARLICQRINCHWDTTQRKAYSMIMGSASIIIGVFSLFAALYLRLTVEQLIMSVLVPLLPVLEFCIRQHKDNWKAGNKNIALKNYIQETWNTIIETKIIDKDELENKVRQIQDMIYDFRCQNPLVFDWLYERLKFFNEKRMAKNISDYAEEYVNALEK